MQRLLARISPLIALTCAALAAGPPVTLTERGDAVVLANGALSATTGVLTAGGFTVENGTISASLAGTGTLTKTTAGTVSLSANNTYTGGTTVSAGTLSLDTSNALAASGTGTTSAPVCFASAAASRTSRNARSFSIGSVTGAMFCE